MLLVRSEGKMKSSLLRLAGTAVFGFVYYCLSLDYEKQCFSYEYVLFNTFSTSTGT